MPKPTFLNLKEEKQKDFIHTCLEEFSQHPFGEASISKIVQELGIAKGSIYQYFEDKSDLYHYLIEISLDRKFDILDFVNQRTAPSLAIWFTQVCLTEVKFAEEFPEMHALLRRAAIDSGEMIRQRERLFIEASLRRFLTELSDKIEMVNIVFLLSIFKSAIVEEYAGKLAESETVERINSMVINIIQMVTK